MGGVNEEWGEGWGEAEWVSVCYLGGGWGGRSSGGAGSGSTMVCPWFVVDNRA